MNQARVQSPPWLRSVGYVCPRCRARLLRDYDDLSCYVCGYHTAGAIAPQPVERATREAA